VTRSIRGNVYEFASRNFIVAYALACGAALVANLLGWWAYRRNGAAFDSVFSTIVSATRDPELRDVFPECCPGMLPLSKESLDAKLRVKRSENNDGHSSNGRHIVPLETRKPVCRICNPATGGRRPSY